MNNGSQSREKVRARDLTAEIDRATDLAVPVGVEDMRGQRFTAAAQGERMTAVTGREKAQQMGWQVIDGGRNETVKDGGVAEVLTPAGEVARDERELTEAQEFVGEESRIQTKERLADDLEDARNEAGEGLGFENRIVAKNQEGVARVVGPEVDKLVNQKSFRVSDLERIYRHGVNTTLGIFGRRIGDRN